MVVLKNDHLLRRAFVESDNLDPLFEGIEILTGFSIERLLIDTERKGTRDYYDSQVPPEVKDMVRRHQLSFESVCDALETINRVYGLGRFDVGNYRYDDDDEDFMTVVGHDLYSVPLVAGDIVSAAEAVVGRYLRITHKEISPGVFEMTASASGAPLEPSGMLERKEYHLREGDIVLEKCSTCGGPAALSELKWKIDRGIIRSAPTGRRIAILEPSVLDPVFEELEKELGETIPRVVVEAQRRFTKTGFYSVDEISDEKRFRDQLALRGMGNLREFSMDRKGMRLRLDNVCMPLMVLGMIQGLFEMAFDKESAVEWELSEGGDLRAEITPLFTQFLSASSL